jgi:hypothetical protein
LATARLTLAISALFAIWMDPTQISWWAHWLLGIYIIHSTVVMLLLRFHKQSRHFDLWFMLWIWYGWP